jgi:hypothetical protein
MLIADWGVIAGKALVYVAGLYIIIFIFRFLQEMFRGTNEFINDE